MNPLLNRHNFEKGGYLTLTEPTTIVRRQEGGAQEESGTWIPSSWPGYREVLGFIERTRVYLVTGYSPASRAVPDAPNTSGVSATGPASGSVQEQLGAPDERPNPDVGRGTGVSAAARTPAPR